jgi:hypothetical protein
VIHLILSDLQGTLNESVTEDIQRSYVPKLLVR